MILDWAWAVLSDNSRVSPFEWSLNVGEEVRKSWMDKFVSGFWTKYCSGDGIDVGGTGYLENVHAVLPRAKIVDLNYPGYDGVTLPFADKSLDYVFSSHTLEHIDDRISILRDWYRVIKNEGYIVITVPHKWLYERKEEKPSAWNEDHRIFYTPANLLIEIEDALPINGYRIRLLEECDKDHTYGLPVEIHANGQYEILTAIQKL